MNLCHEWWSIHSETSVSRGSIMKPFFHCLGMYKARFFIFVVRESLVFNSTFLLWNLRSPISAPTFVETKDNSLCLVMDYLVFIEVTIRNGCDLPPISILGPFNKAKYYTKLNCRCIQSCSNSSKWQMEIYVHTRHGFFIAHKYAFWFHECFGIPGLTKRHFNGSEECSNGSMLGNASFKVCWLSHNVNRIINCDVRCNQLQVLYLN